MKSPEPYFRTFDGWWYIQLWVNGRRKQIKLAKGKDNEALAMQEWHKLCASQPATLAVPEGSVLELLDRFIKNGPDEVSTATFDWYHHFLKDFKAWLVKQGDAELDGSAFDHTHVEAWLKSKKWSRSTKSGAVKTFRKVFRWLHDGGHISKYPLTKLKARRPGRRETIISPEKFQEILAAVKDQQFKDYLQFLHASGCRPQEAAHAEKRHYQPSMRRLLFAASESKGGEYPRVIYLNDMAVEIVERLVKRWPEGKIFRNRKHKPWDRNAVRCRFRRLRKKVGRFCAYHLRHTFATEALQALDAFTVSVLMGHADVSTLARQYQHLAKAPGFLQQAVNKARGA